MTQHTQPITAESIFYKIFEPQPMIVEGLISKGLTVLGGSPKIGKSWLALDLAISVANGVPFLGKSVQKTGVLYYCLEDTYLRVRNRMHELVDEPPDNLYVSTSSERIGSGFTRDIVSFLRDHRDIDLIIVDTLQKIRGADDGSGSGSYSKDYDEISKLKEIADLNNKSIIAIHHLRQKPDLNDPFNEITGTNGITGVSDTNIVLKRREGSTTAEMYVRGRDVEERKLILEFVDLRWHMLEEKSASEIEKEKIPEVLYKVLEYKTTNRDGYREYKSKGKICANCPHLTKCTESQNHIKLIQRHIWADYMDIVEDIRHTDEGKELYRKRKETIERVFGTAKEHHAMRYTQQVGKEKMAMKVGLTFACMNMKKLVNILSKRPENGPDGGLFDDFLSSFFGLFTRSFSYV